MINYKLKNTKPNKCQNGGVSEKNSRILDGAGRHRTRMRLIIATKIDKLCLFYIKRARVKFECNHNIYMSKSVFILLINHHLNW